MDKAARATLQSFSDAVFAIHPRSNQIPVHMMTTDEQLVSDLHARTAELLEYYRNPHTSHQVRQLRGSIEAIVRTLYAVGRLAEPAARTLMNALNDLPDDC